MRHIFIINPMAGKRGSTKKLEADIRALDVPAEIVLTQETGDARRIARAAAEAGDLPAAIERAYALADRIRFDNAYCRRDIGRRALEALQCRM